MKSTRIYEDYTRIMLELSMLQNEYSRLDATTAPEKRANIQDRINHCRARLTSVTDILIHSNPFQKAKHLKSAAEKEVI